MGKEGGRVEERRRGAERGRQRDREDRARETTDEPVRDKGTRKSRRKDPSSGLTLRKELEPNTNGKSNAAREHDHCREVTFHPPDNLKKAHAARP